MTTQDLKTLSGRTALVTGANRGIGLAIAQGLAARGAHVILAARSLDAAQQAAARIGGKVDVVPAQLDVASPQSCATLCDRLKTDGHEIDILINNAGVLHEGALLDLEEAQLAQSMAVHIAGPWRLIRALAPAMIERGHGRIVNLSSGWGSFAEGLGPEAYGVTKAALNAMTVRLAGELPKTVKVNAMCPGWVRTRMGGAGAPRTPQEGADTALWLAGLPDDGPTGGFFRDRRPLPW